MVEYREEGVAFVARCTVSDKTLKQDIADLLP